MVEHPHLSHIAPACKFGCVYCFASDPEYFAIARDSASALDSSHDAESPEVIMLSGDTELFVDPEVGAAQVEAALNRGCHLTFATKMVLPESVLQRLVRVQGLLRQSGKILSIMVSIPTLGTHSDLEPRVPSPEARINFLQVLHAAGLHPFVGIRPILPPDLVADDELREIVDRSGPFVHGFITGPYWFSTDVLHLIGRSDLPISRRRVHWLPGNPEWFVYEDIPREARLIEYIASSGFRHFLRSSEAIREIAAEASR